MGKYPGRPYRGPYRPPSGTPRSGGFQSGTFGAMAGAAAGGALPLPPVPPQAPPVGGGYIPPGVPANNNWSLPKNLPRGGGFARFFGWIGMAAWAYALYEWWRSDPWNWGLNMMGYQQVLSCNRPVDLTKSGASTFHCGLTGQAFGGPPYGAWNGITRPSYLAKWWHSHDNALTGQARWAISENWQRVGSVDRPRFLPDPRWSPDDDPLPHPSQDPSVMPIGQPAPIPHSPPVPNPGPNFDPRFDPESPVRLEPEIEPVPSPLPSPYPPPAPSWPTLPQPNPSPSPTPVPAPGVNIPNSPVARPTLNPKPRNRPKRPPQNEKERKQRLTPHGASVVGRSVNWLSETGDFIEAIWWALPAKYRSPPEWDPIQKRWHAVGHLQKAQDIYDHLDQVDMNKAFENLLAEQLGDLMAGKVGQGVAASNQKMGQFGGQWNGWALGPAL